MSATIRTGNNPRQQSQTKNEIATAFTKPRNDVTVWRNSAFTLAEVLITLGIIGIVSAMTIPNLITNYKKHSTVVKVKEAYSIVSRLVKDSERENGANDSYTSINAANYNDTDTNKIMKEYFLPQLSGATNISKYHLISTLRAGGTFLSWNTGNCAGSVYALNNGMYIGLRVIVNDYPYLYFIVDINGPDNPNVLGIDAFVFELNIKNNIVTPAGWQYSNKQILSGEAGASSCVRGKNAWSYYAGIFCSTLIIRDGAVSNDYPWGNGGQTPSND